MPRPRSKQKKQTRLNFTSSSPSANSYSQEVQSSLPSARYGTRLTFGRNMNQFNHTQDSSNVLGQNATVPIGLDSSSDGDQGPSTKKPAAFTKKTKDRNSLPTPVPSSQAHERTEEPDTAKVGSDAAPKIQSDDHLQDESVQAKEIIKIEDSTTEDSDTAKAQEQARQSSTSEDDVIVVSGRKRRGRAIFSSDEDEQDPPETEERHAASASVAPSPSPSPTVTRRSTYVTRARGRAQVPMTPSKRKRSGSHQIPNSGRSLRSSNRRDALRSHDKPGRIGRTRQGRTHVSSDMAEAETSGDENMTKPGVHRRVLKGRQTPKQSSYTSDPFINDDGESTENSDDVPSPSKRRRRLSTARLKSSQSLPQSPKTLSHRDSATMRKEIDDDAKDLADDSGSEIDVNAGRGRRSFANTRKAERMKALERFKRQREGHYEAGSDDNEYERSAPRHFVDVEQSNDAERMSIDAESDTIQQENLDGYEEDFIDDEGATGEYELPIEFSDFATRPIKDLFKFVVEWLVKNKVHKAFHRHDEIYRLAFDKVNSEAAGLAGQTLSASWGPHPRGVEFGKALKARPEMHIMPLDGGIDLLHCEACNRAGHPARFAIYFSGPTYDKDTLDIPEPSDDDEDSSASAGNDSHDEQHDEASDENGDNEDEVPGPNDQFKVGNTCKANAWSVHNLTHWKWHLNQLVMVCLHRNGYMSDAAVVERFRMSDAKLEKLANRIVDKMEDEDEILELYRRFRNLVKAARGEEADRLLAR